MTSIITADWHLDSNSRNEYRHTFVGETLPEMIKDLQADRLICLGDICQDKDRHSAALVNRVVEEITALSQLCEVVILRGNHDYIDPASPFFAFLSKMPKIHWINKPAFMWDELFLPHTRDYQRDWKGVDFRKTKIIFAHQTFAGANAGNHILDGIPLSVFPEGVDIISGDVHVPQKLKNLRYVGAPYTINFGDSFKPRVLVLRGDKITTLPVPGPQKVLLEINDPEELSAIRLNEGDMLKVRIRISKLDGFQQAKKAIADWAGQQGYALHVVQPVPPEQGPIRERGTIAVKTDEGHVRFYAGRVGLSKEVLEVGLRLMEGDK